MPYAGRAVGNCAAVAFLWHLGLKFLYEFGWKEHIHLVGLHWMAVADSSVIGATAHASRDAPLLLLPPASFLCYV